MKMINEQLSTPVEQTADVIVVGAGPAGVGAALSAAREGVKTILIEPAGDVGGVATIGMMSHWTGNTKGGLYEEILDKTSDCNEYCDTRCSINTEKLKTKMLNMLVEAGVDVKLYTYAVAPVMEGDTIKGVICEAKQGRVAYMADVVIDCSGDGDIAARAGAEYIKGRETDGKMQPMTLMFKVGGVDKNRMVLLHGFEHTYETEKGELQALAKLHIPFPAGHLLVYNNPLKDVITCNMTNVINVDGTDSNDLTKATLTCRNQMDDIIKYLNEFVPGFENCYIITSASFIGIRETRHFKGVKTITEQDIAEARVFDDWVVTKAHFNFDIHNISGSGLDETGCQKHFKQATGYTIPYGCLVPIKIDGLLLAGRNISGTHKAHSNYRVMPICMNMGQAAGIAAAIAVKKNIIPRDVDVNEIQARLTELGVTVD
ncbi:MAG: FAD-dependent oxidoreductase [Eubacteriales bacterium]|nr:FAD-dependent oxidoreductase [Eubacteriales bacterium]